jgi:hypothetical protein
MQNLIDETYFWGDIDLGTLFRSTNGVLLSEAGANTSSELERYIAKYQKDYLKQMFGAELAADLPAELATLVYDEDVRTSPIADYVYFHYMRNMETTTTPMGEKGLTAQNTITKTNEAKIYRAMKRCIEESLAIHKALYELGTITVNVDTDDEEELNYLEDINDKIDLNITYIDAKHVYYHSKSDIFDTKFNMWGV